MDTENRRIATEFDNYTEEYGRLIERSVKFSGLDADFFARVKAEYIVEILTKYFGDSTRLKVLDLGCGVGTYCQMLSDRIGELHGVDISHRSIEKARALYPEGKFDAYDGDRLPYRDGTFDAVFAICVMHHVPPENWVHFAREMRRILRPEGLGLILEHNPLNPLTRVVVSRCPFDADAVLLGPREVRLALRNAGFQEVTHRFILTLPAAGLIGRRIDRFFGFVPLGAQYYCAAIA